MFLQVLIAFSAILIKLTSGQSCLDVHNMYRQKHSVPNLQKSQRLEWHATKRAKELASTDIFEHEKNSPYGENLYWKTGRIPSCYDAISKWYNEIDIYDYNRAGYSKATGHFTQVIWRDTTHVGCASAKSDRTQRVYIVCTYSPAGNYRGEYEDNVPPLQTSTYGYAQGHATHKSNQRSNYNSWHTTATPRYNTRKASNPYYNDNSAYENNNNVYSSNSAYYGGNNNANSNYYAQDNVYHNNKQYNYYTKKYTHNNNNNYKYNYNYKYRYQYR